MAQRFLLSAAARLLSFAKIMRLSDAGVEDVFLRLRWPETDGKPACPDCGCSIRYACRRPAGQLRWRCKACRHIAHGTVVRADESPAWNPLHARFAGCARVSNCRPAARPSQRLQLGGSPAVPPVRPR